MKFTRRLTWQDVMHSAQLLATTTTVAPAKRNPTAPAELLDATLHSGHWLLTKLPRVQPAS